jgi:hypothetical protein
MEITARSRAARSLREAGDDIDESMEGTGMSMMQWPQNSMQQAVDEAARLVWLWGEGVAIVEYDDGAYRAIPASRLRDDTWMRMNKIRRIVQRIHAVTDLLRELRGAMEPEGGLSESQVTLLAELLAER